MKKVLILKNNLAIYLLCSKNLFVIILSAKKIYHLGIEFFIQLAQNNNKWFVEC